MSMPAPAPSRFIFDLDLGRSNEKSRIIGEYALAELLEEAKKDGFERGVVEGENNATATAAKKLANDARSLLKLAETIHNGADRMHEEVRANAIRLSISVARKLAGNMIARHPLGEIENLIAECVSSLEQVPHLVIRCNETLAQRVKKEAEAQINTSGFSGRLVVMGEPDIALGDARLEWVDGGLERDISQISARIDERIAAFLAGGKTSENPVKTVESAQPQTGEKTQSPTGDAMKDEKI
ncbi:MAG: hypothetical protein ACC631_04965 [Halocynthiibacter sp.]